MSTNKVLSELNMFGLVYKNWWKAKDGVWRAFAQDGVHMGQVDGDEVYSAHSNEHLELAAVAKRVFLTAEMGDTDLFLEFPDFRQGIKFFSAAGDEGAQKLFCQIALKETARKTANDTTKCDCAYIWPLLWLMHKGEGSAKIQLDERFFVPEHDEDPRQYLYSLESDFITGLYVLFQKVNAHDFGFVKKVGLELKHDGETFLLHCSIETDGIIDKPQPLNPAGDRVYDGIEGLGKVLWLLTHEQNSDIHYTHDSVAFDIKLEYDGFVPSGQ